MPTLGGELIMYPTQLKLSKDEILSRYGDMRMRPNMYIESYFLYEGEPERNVRVTAKFKPTLKGKSLMFVDFLVARTLSELDEEYDLYDVHACLYGAKS